MSRVEREIAKQRKRLMAIEANGMSEVARAYQVVLKDLNRELAAVTERIEVARRAHRKIGTSWLSAQERYQALVAQHEENTLDYLRSCIRTVTKAKKAAGELAQSDAPALTQAVLGDLPSGVDNALLRRAESYVANTFSKLPAEQMARLVRNAADGRPLGNPLAEIAPKATQGVKDAMLSGVARGAPVRTIADDVRRASGIAQNRAMLISRTETIRVYRETCHEQYRRSPVVTGWIWIAEVNACPVCSCEHGSRHSLDESLASHPGCRCVEMPETLSWSELGFPNIPDTRPQITPGPERFAALPEADKLAILGRARLEAYNAGEITLADMVKETHSARWGDGKRTATLVELGVG